MPKKTRRQVSKSAAFMPAQPRAGTTEFNPDYTYIRRDLRRIAMLAAGFFVVLVALAFVLH